MKTHAFGAFALAEVADAPSKCAEKKKARKLINPEIGEGASGPK